MAQDLYKEDLKKENKDKTIECRECKEIKHISEYFNRKNYKDGKEKICKSCVRIYSNKLKLNHTKEQIINRCISVCEKTGKNRAKKGRIKCGEFNLTQNDIKELIKKQENKCIYSGEELVYKYNDDYKISIDRIDCNKGYTKDNIQLVGSHINQMRMDLTHDNFIYYIKTIYENQNKINDENKNIEITSIIQKRISKLLSCCKVSGRKRQEKGRIECGEYNLDNEYIQKLLIKQNNKCYFSGLEMVWNTHNNGDLQASIDRIDSNKGYLKSNVKLVCNIVNQMKLHKTNEEFLIFVKQIYNHSILKQN